MKSVKVNIGLLIFSSICLIVAAITSTFLPSTSEASTCAAWVIAPLLVALGIVL